VKQLVLLLNIVVFVAINVYAESADFNSLSDNQSFYTTVKHLKAQSKSKNMSMRRHQGKRFLDRTENMGYNDEALLFDTEKTYGGAVVLGTIEHGGFTAAACAAAVPAGTSKQPNLSKLTNRQIK
jgi:hypothetical protein